MSGELKTGQEAYWKLGLYVVHTSPQSREALKNLKTLLEEVLPGQYELKIIDILESPLTAIKDGIVVTPTLIKWAPLPVCRMVGTLQERELVLGCLGLDNEGKVIE